MQYSPEKRDTLTISAFGIINSGKSSLLNALLGRDEFPVDPRGGWTTEARSAFFTSNQSTLNIKLVDAPGLGEIEGHRNYKIARSVAEEADLAIFVVHSDLIDEEFKALTELHDYGKPMIFVLNKSDIYSESDRGKILSSISRKLEGIIDTENIIVTAAAPIRKVVRIDFSGQEEQVEEKPVPDVETLLRRIIAICNREGQYLIKFTSLIGEMHRQKQLTEEQKKDARRKSETVVYNWATGTAVGIAVNPIPIVDLAGLVAAAAKMIDDVGKQFGYKFKEGEALNLARDLWREVKNQMIVTISLIILGSTTKWFGGAIIQAGAAGYLFVVLGGAAIVYFENNKSWGDEGLRQVLQEIIQNTDKNAITRPIVDRVRKQLQAKEKPAESTSQLKLFDKEKAATAEFEKHNEALERLDEAIRANPENGKAWFDKGIVLKKLKKYKEALECFDESIRIDPKDAQAWYNRGLCLKKLGKYKEAVKSYDKAVKLNPHHDKAWFNKGIALKRLKKHNEAIKCYDQAIKITPKYHNAWFNKSIALKELGRYSEVPECYEAIETKPAHRQKGETYIVGTYRTAEEEGDEDCMREEEELIQHELVSDWENYARLNEEGWFDA